MFSVGSVNEYEMISSYQKEAKFQAGYHPWTFTRDLSRLPCRPSDTVDRRALNVFCLTDCMPQLHQRPSLLMQI